MQVDKSFSQVKTGHLNSIAQAVWMVDETQIDLLLNGITRLPNMAFAEIHHGNDKIASSGGKLKQQSIVQDPSTLWVGTGEEVKP